MGHGDRGGAGTSVAGTPTIAAVASEPTRRIIAGLAGLATLAVHAASIDASAAPPDTVATTAGGGIDDLFPDGASGSLVVVRGDELVSCRGWGESDRSAGVAATCDTVYDVMSMTKQFTAAAVLALQMEGRVSVADPITAFVDDVPADKQDITIHQLLTHTAGFVEILGDDYDPLSRPDLVSAALASELQSAPGTEYLYSNVGYSLLAVIIEEASGTSYEQYLASRLFEPAGMTHTGYVLPDWDNRDVAVEYDADGTPQGRPFDHPWADDGPYWNLRGNGGLLSTARDMSRWHVALTGDEVLDAEAKRQLFAPAVLEEPGGDTWYGYGWVLADPDGGLAWHNGGNDWSYGEIARSPDGSMAVFWATNQVRSSDPAWDLDELSGDITEAALLFAADAG